MTTAFARTLPRVLITTSLALTASIAAFSATTAPVRAAPSQGSYAVTLANQLPAPRREIVDGAVWRCEGERCIAPADGGRALAVCGRIARKIGPVARFVGPQGELSAEQLARCNG